MESTAGGVRSSTGTDVGMDAMTNGWLLFAAIMLLFAGIWNAVEGFFALFRSAYFIGSAVFGSLWIWALVWLAFGLLLIGASAAIMGGRSWGRWFGIIVVGLSAFVHLLAMGTYPWWSAVMVGIDVVILYALAAHWHRTETA